MARVVQLSDAASAYVPEWGEERERYDAGDNPDPVWCEITPMSGDEITAYNMAKNRKGKDNPKLRQRAQEEALRQHAALHNLDWSDGKRIEAHDLFHVKGYAGLAAELFLAVYQASVLSEGTRRGLTSQSGCSQPQAEGTSQPSQSSGGAAPDAGGSK